MIFWTLIVALTVVWYLLITLFVAYRGGQDIRKMVKRLTSKQSNDREI